jgi:hypothetical protein
MLWIFSGFEHERGAGVAEIAKSLARKALARQRGLQSVGDSGGVQRRPDLRREHEAAVVPASAGATA